MDEGTRGGSSEVLGRIDRLERENRRLKVAGAVVAGLVVLAAAGRQQGGARTYDEVKARRFVVVDAAGAERGLLGMSGETPRIALGSSLASPQLQIDAQQDQVNLGLRVPGQPASVNLFANTNGGLVEADRLRGRLGRPSEDRPDRD